MYIYSDSANSVPSKETGDVATCFPSPTQAQKVARLRQGHGVPRQQRARWSHGRRRRSHHSHQLRSKVVWPHQLGKGRRLVHVGRSEGQSFCTMAFINIASHADSANSVPSKETGDAATCFPSPTQAHKVARLRQGHGAPRQQRAS